MSAGKRVDSFWLDIKAYHEDVYKRLCGTTNKWILEAPKLIVDMGFVLEVLTLYIPGWVELKQIAKIAELIADVDKSIPFTILAFFPEYKLRGVRPPNLLRDGSGLLRSQGEGLGEREAGEHPRFC